ncbi:hypothetical protein FPQ18DRAFT_352629 [Pyronema domesticum]|uniref:Uncharacterized protein n=1 Tax=Pyronema omphalodes (strain CBS 100304) TaxID=1076935 RepID=U4LXL5_PYROM|nr:hypothetical protein FPQ18DRAFT_352629 [Pyronema domesticum]CCX34503.1 Protein of unknown function [Pyronema omphalodes CBS 100304]
MSRNQLLPRLFPLIQLLAMSSSASAAGRMCKGTKEENPECWHLSLILTIILVGLIVAIILYYFLQLCYILFFRDERTERQEGRYTRL